MRYRLLILAVLAVFLVPSFLMSQSGVTANRIRNYNPATETTIKGDVEEVLQSAGQRGWAGVHLKLKSDQGIYDVHVGPAFFLSSQQFTFTKGDNLEVIGSKAVVNGHDVLIARQITKGGKILALRNSQGIPLWSRRGSQTK